MSSPEVLQGMCDKMGVGLGAGESRARWPVGEATWELSAAPWKEDRHIVAVPLVVMQPRPSQAIAQGSVSAAVTRVVCPDNQKDHSQLYKPMI